VSYFASHVDGSPWGCLFAAVWFGLGGTSALHEALSAWSRRRRGFAPKPSRWAGDFPTRWPLGGATIGTAFVCAAVVFALGGIAKFLA
jgi:hypothetical protein